MEMRVLYVLSVAWKEPRVKKGINYLIRLGRGGARTGGEQRVRGEGWNAGGTESSNCSLRQSI